MGWRPTARHVGLLVCLAILPGPMGCAQSTSGQPGEKMAKTEVSRMLHMAFRAALPPFATEVDGHAYTVQESVYLMRFVCTERQLQEFLDVSPVLPNQLDSSVCAIDDSLARPEWWHPDEMGGPAGLRLMREDDTKEYHCQLLAGAPDRNGQREVYVRLNVIRTDLLREADRMLYEKAGQPIPEELLSRTNGGGDNHWP